MAIEPLQFHQPTFASPPSPGPREPNALQVIGSGVANILAAMQQAKDNQYKEQELAMQRATAASQQRYYDTLNTGNALENTKKTEGLATDRQKRVGEELGNKAFNTWLASGADPQKMGVEFAKLNNPYAAQHLLGLVFKHAEAQGQIGTARGNLAEADVKEGTKAPKIAEAGSAAERAASDATTAGINARVASATEAAQVAQPGLQNSYTRALTKQALSQAAATGGLKLNAIDDAATKLWRSSGGQMTLGDAYKRYGATPPEGVDPQSKFQPQSAGMAMYKAKAKIAAGQIQFANSELDDLITGGVKITESTIGKMKIPLQAGRRFIPEPEQRMLAAGGQVLSQYALMVTGQAMSEQEAQRLALQIMPQAGDKPGSVKAKQVRREAILRITYDASQGAGRPMSEIVGDVIRASRAKGMDPQFLNYLNRTRGQALKMEQEYAKNPANYTPPLTADTDPSTPDGVSSLLDSVGY